MAITWGIPHFQINSDDYFGRCRFVFGLKNGHWRLPLPWKNHGKLSAVQISGRCGSRELGDDLLPRRDWVLSHDWIFDITTPFWLVNELREWEIALSSWNVFFWFDCTRIVFVWTRGATNREHPCWSSPVFSTWNTSADGPWLYQPFLMWVNP